MGVQATMTVGNKRSASAVPVATGAASYPPTTVPPSVSIVAILPAADLHRLADVERAINMCLDYIREANFTSSPGAVSVVTTLDGGKSAIRTETIVANVVTGDVGVLMVGGVRAISDRNYIDEAHKQLSDWMRENRRLVS